MIVCAANRDSEGKIIVGPRHWDTTMVRTVHAMGNFNFNDKKVEQGFIDQFGVFLTREEAWIVAEAAGQIKYRVGGDNGKLFSENLY